MNSITTKKYNNFMILEPTYWHLTKDTDSKLIHAYKLCVQVCIYMTVTNQQLDMQRNE